jgi:general secretion pathway protein N
VTVAARLPLALAGLLGLCLAGEVVLLAGGPRDSRFERVMPAVAPPRPAVPVGATETILARPLFLPGRHGQQRDLPTAKGGDGVPRLSAIVVAGDKRLAVFQPPTGKPMALREGDVVGGWTIHTIDRRQVVLQKAGGTMTIEPSKDLAAGAVGAATPKGRAPFQAAPAQAMPGPAGALPFAPGKAPRP